MLKNLTPFRRTLFSSPRLLAGIFAATIAILAGDCAAAEPAGEPAALVLACRPDNDLYRTLVSNGLKCARYDTADEAVRQAPLGAGVLLLADGYPATPLAVGQAAFDEAAKKKLRLLVEYPASLPGLEVGKPRAGGVERAVIASDFFQSLPAGRILAISGLHFVPVNAKQGPSLSPALVAARVAGFDTAVYGLPKQTHPILFEHPQGEILVSTTCLSRFLIGRYAPQDAWRGVWRGILKWLDPSAPVAELKWTPLVGPTYGPDDRLPADAERQALVRGVEWFIKSKLLLHPSRIGGVGKAPPAFWYAAGMVPTPPPDAPVGDGTLGILEAPLSVIQADGSQLQGVSRRGDCHGESAMALAFGGKVLDDPRKQAIAGNLLDFWYFTSDACKRQRGDPKHGAYGLAAWGIDTPAWYKANYGDDNARLLLGTMATAGLTGESRWDEAMMKCLLANLRTTGPLGFRGERIDLPALSAQGWRPFFERRIVSYWPHMEAYLWACYLWAYERTGYEPFYQRAECAIRMTMAQYTDGWRWTNGLAQEKARMLLPLAWLVRVKDTPEHRAWLGKVVEGVVVLQQPCGAIREELGLPGHGHFPPPRSNEAYGTHEASLIQNNGDPVCDMLYTANFAFIGLHEAAAVGDQKAAQAEEKLADFLCRIQVRSQAQPSLDGGWFRAFDYSRWEPWASNADAGWGAWAIESGWTQGWIVSVLAMRQMNTALWDLARQSGINRHFDKLRREMLPDEVLAPPPTPHPEPQISLTLIPPSPVTDKITLDIRGAVWNNTAAARKCQVSFYLDEERPENRLHHETLDVPPGAPAAAKFRWPTKDRAGKHRITFVAQCEGKTLRFERPIEIIASDVRSTRRLGGAWVDFYHGFNAGEGRPFNEELGKITADDWRALVRAMHETDQNILVITMMFENDTHRGRHKIETEGYHGKAFYPSKLYPGRMPIACPDPLEAVLGEADRLGMHVMPGVGNYAFFDYTPASLQWHKKVADELWQRYGHHPSFYGWYISAEKTGSLGNAEERREIVDFFTAFTPHVRRLAPDKPVMLAPNCFRARGAEDTYRKLLPQLDILCPFGYHRMPRGDQSGEEAAKMMQLLCDEAGCRLWMDLESFVFGNGKQLYPRPIEGFVSDFTRFDNFEKTLHYAFTGMMSSPKMPRQPGGPASVKLYEDYGRYLREGGAPPRAAAK